MLTDFERRIEGLYTAKFDLDLKTLTKSSYMMEHIVNMMLVEIPEPPNPQGNFIAPATSCAYLLYNLCLFPLPGFHDVYHAIREMFITCMKDSGGDLSEKYVLQSWLNVYKKGEYIEWHSHQPPNYNAWHGFFCVNVEPDSYTEYKWEQDPNRKDLILRIDSKNNLMVLGKSDNDKHHTSVWEKETPRITIAYDIIPVKALNSGQMDFENFMNAKMTMRTMNPAFINHWIPI